MSTAKRLWPLAGASMKADLSAVNFGDSGPVSLPLPTFLIEHDRGLILLDTGLRPDAWDKGPGAVYGAVNDIFPFDSPPKPNTPNTINKAGFKLEDVTHVIVSHTHIDHTGGLYLFPNAEFYISQAELAYTFWPHPFWAATVGREDLERARSFKWNPLTTDHDLFGDGSLQILQTPGHTPGQTTLLVKLPTRTFVLVGDAAHSLKNMEGVPCPVDLDSLSAFHSVQRIKQISAAHQADIWVMHDVEQWAEFGHPSQPYS